MGKQVSIKMLEQEVKMYDEFVEIPVTIQGSTDEYVIKLYPSFKPERVRELVDEMIEFFKAAEKENLTVPQVEEDDLVGFFAIKYFTNLKFTTSKKAKTIYKDFKTVINTSVFKELSQTFPKKSTDSIIARIYEVRDQSATFKTMINRAQQVIQDLPLESRDKLIKNDNESVTDK